MSRSARRFIPSLRPRSLAIVTLFLIVSFLAFRPAEPAYRPALQDDRLSHLMPELPDVEEDKGGFSPLKALGLHEWVPGQRKRILIVGGATHLGLSVVPTLQNEYEIYIYDTPPRPAALPVSTHIHYLRTSTTSLSSLLSEFPFVGVIEMNGLDLSEKCRVDQSECLDHYRRDVSELLHTVSQKSRKRWWKGVPTGAPWILLATESPIRSHDSDMTDVDGTHILVEDHLKSYLVGGETGVEDQPSSAKAAIARFSTIYGYPPYPSLPDTFVQSTIVHSAVSASTQFDSDLAPLDLVHIDDAVQGLLAKIRRMETSPLEGTLEETDFVSGHLTNRKDFVDLVRNYAGSLGPLKDLGSNLADNQKWTEKDYQVAENVFGWKPSVTLTQGILDSLRKVYKTNMDWAEHYIQTSCSSSSLDITPADPETLDSNIKNKDLGRLAGCEVIVGFNRDGFLDYVKCPAANGTTCVVDNQKVVSYNWGATYFLIRVQGSGRHKGRMTVSFEERDHGNYLGISLKGKPELGLYPKDTKEAQLVFDVEVQHDQSNLRLTVPSTGQQLMAVPDRETNTTTFRFGDPSAYDARFNVLCCPVEGDWPLLEDDYEAADIRFGSTGDIPFNASRQTYTCDKADKAYVYSQQKLKELGENEGVQPIESTTLPAEWALKDLPVCWNDCSSPAICVYDGACRCVQAECPNKRASLAHVADAPKGPKKSVLGVHGGFSPQLMYDVSRGNWTDILLPHFRSYLDKHSKFPSLHVVSGYPGEEQIESAECHKLAPTHCFSADSILYRAMRHLSVPAEEAELIVLPVYQHCEGADFMLHDVMHYAGETIPGIKENEKKVAIVLTHDWGICIAFAWEIWSARENHNLYPDWILDNMLVWSVMGDFNSPCYRPQQDIVIPPRTCPTPLLRETFEDIKNVMPARDRPRLVAWAGTYWGTGKSERMRMTCDRGGAGEREVSPGSGSQSMWINWDYMTSLGTSRFCPQPMGIAGWSPRVNDAIYAGCIPVLTAEGTHYPLSSALDWTKFSVRLLPTDLDRLEEILAAIPIEKVEEMQKNLMLIREGFLYSTDEHPEQELERRGPMFWALHAAGMKLGTEYPTTKT